VEATAKKRVNAGMKVSRARAGAALLGAAKQWSAECLTQVAREAERFTRCSMLSRPS
jgi:hypothetical protein